MPNRGLPRSLASLIDRIEALEAITAGLSLSELSILDFATLSTAELNILDGVTATAAELNKLDDSLATNYLSRGAGVDTAESYASGIFRSGSLTITRIVLDISTLVGSATDLDIIGESAAADCNWGQITTAKCGTLIGGRVTCLEVPAGGTADINFYSSSASTGAQDALASGLAGVSTLIDAGGAWTSGATKGMTALPAANDYLYIANGAASGGTFSAGKFEIVLFGTA